MAVSGVSSSSSIYGNRNVITGLASGLDTESMIENAISAYKNKITALNQKRTKTVWKQDAYRSIINKLSSFTSKYTSFQSSSNLMSASFWNQAVNTVSKGKYADLVSATGRSSSNIQIDRVRQLATSATYKLSGSIMDSSTSSFGADTVSAVAGGTLNLDGKTKVSGLTGSLTLAYGGANSLSYLDIEFENTTIYEGQTDENGRPISVEQALANEINRQLETQSVTIGTKTYTGKELTENVLRAEVKNGKITFADPKGNNVYISGAIGGAESFLGGREISTVSGKQVKDLTLNSTTKDLLKTQEKNTLSYLGGESAGMTITVDGVTKTVKLPTYLDVLGYSGTKRDEKYLSVLQKNIDNAFGAGKLTVSDANGDEDGIQFKFDVAKGSSFSVYSSQGKVLGLGESKQVTSYLNTGKTLGELLSGTDFAENFQKAQVTKTDSNGNTTKVDATDANGKPLYSFMVNGVEIGQFNEDSTLSDVMNAMNNNSASGVKVSYSKLTNELTFTAKETGEASEIKFGGLAAALFGSPEGSDTYTKGQDAIFEASVNGTSLGELKRSSNSVEMDGMTINLKGTFGYETNEDGSLKYNTTYDTNDKGQIVFKGGNGKELYGELQDDGTVKLVDANDDAFTYNGQKVFGKMDETGNLSFYVPGTDGEEDLRVYLMSDGSFSDTDNKTTYDTNDKGQIVFKGSNGKELYGELQDDGTVKLVDANDNAFTYKPSSASNPYKGSEIYARMDSDGNLNFYMTYGTNDEEKQANEKQVYLLDSGGFSVTDRGYTAGTAVTQTEAVTAGTTVTKTVAKTANSEAVTFETSSDADKIVDLIKQMVEDYNTMVTEIRSAYSTMPLQRSSGSYYEPLTEDEESGMTESAISTWNENAKTGILFGDSDLRNLYTRLTSAISMTGEFGATLRAAGITVNYSDGLSTLSFDEDKFRTALENDPDKVRDAFTASTDSGSPSNGLMQALKIPMDVYGKTSGGKGILVELAGSPLASSSMYSNTIQKQLDNIDAQIERWQEKMEDQIDYYTNKFSQLEQLVQQMNSQSSYLSQLMGSDYY